MYAGVISGTIKRYIHVSTARMKATTCQQLHHLPTALMVNEITDSYYSVVSMSGDEASHKATMVHYTVKVKIFNIYTGLVLSCNSTVTVKQMTVITSCVTISVQCLIHITNN